MDMNINDFNKLIAFIRSKYGINLDNKQHLIQARLSEVIHVNGFASFSQYVDHIITYQNDKDIEVMLNVLTTNYTYFMRETAHFDFFKDNVLPQLERNKSDKVLSIWCAGCAYGQEAYTLSMILKDYFRGKGKEWDTRVLASDISIQALTEASKGVYSSETVSTLPKAWIDRYFTQIAGGDSYAVTEELRSNVIFRHFNLMEPIKFKLQFDVIFCRNVMIYFDKGTRDELTKRFYDVTLPDGYLFVGHSEGLTSSETGYQYIMPATYRKVL